MSADSASAASIESTSATAATASTVNGVLKTARSERDHGTAPQHEQRQQPPAEHPDRCDVTAVAGGHAQRAEHSEPHAHGETLRVVHLSFRIDPIGQESTDRTEQIGNSGVTGDVRADMTAHQRPRVLGVALAAATLLAACGTEGSTRSSPASPADSGSDGSLRPPVAVEAIAGSAIAGGDAATMSAESAASTDMATMPAFVGFMYEVGDGLPALPANSTAYQYPANVDADEAAVAAVAAALGVASLLERVDDATIGQVWRAGRDDGTAPSLGVSRDPQLTWYYSGAWDDQVVPMVCGTVVEVDATLVPTVIPTTTTTIVGGDAVAGSDGGGTEPCAPPEPPVGVLTAAEAEAETNDLLAAIGEDPASFELETYADEWFASVSAWPTLDGVRSPTAWGFGFGAEGVLQWTNGSLAEPLPAGPYPLVELDAALARLAEQSSLWKVGGGDPLVDVVGPSPSTTTSGAGSAGSTGATTAETIGPEPAPPPPVTTAIAPDVPVVIDAPAPGVPPTVPAEPVVATLVDVRADFWWASDADGSVWLLPAYTFTDTEDRHHTVPAVTDEFLIVADTPTNDPPMVEPTTTSSAPTEPQASPPASAPAIDSAVLEGLDVDEAAEVLAEQGLTLRVVREDGVDLAVTEDFSGTRVNVAVDSGIVTAVVFFG